jgi:hypothetical protein
MLTGEEAGSSAVTSGGSAVYRVGCSSQASTRSRAATVDYKIKNPTYTQAEGRRELFERHR